MSEKNWFKEYWIQLLAGLSIVVICTLATFIWPLFLKNIATDLLIHLKSNFEMPFLLFYLFVLILIIFAVYYRKEIRHIFKSHKTNTATYTSVSPESDSAMAGIPKEYLEMINKLKKKILALGVKWEWDNELKEDGTLGIKNLRMICPNCDLELEPVNVGYWDEVNNEVYNKTSIRCIDCNHEYYEALEDRDLDYFLNIGRKYIERELRQMGL